MSTTAAATELRGGRAAAWLFTFAVLFSAALVFAVQPLAGKLLLPLLGGSAAVWNASLAFFQGALLAGYAYAHLLQRLESVRGQVLAHLAVLALAGLALPLRVSGLFGDPWSDAPPLWVVATLTVSLGAPFAALSATAPLLQAWFARAGLRPIGGRDVYGLYAASNLGSLLALAAYPLVIEPLVGLQAQAAGWSLAYAAFVLALAAAGLSVWRRDAGATAAASMDRVEPIGWRRRLVWIGLAAVPSSLLLGVTAHITADVASAPLLWVVPLTLYLATFIYAFARGRGPDGWALRAQLAAAAGALLMLGPSEWLWPLPVHLIAFTVSALICHQALVARRPPEARLTDFYLSISVGGVLGGGFNAFIAPLLFPGVWEYPLVLALAFLARPPGGKLQFHQKLWCVAGVVWTLPLMAWPGDLPRWAAVALLLTPAVIASMLWRHPRAVTVLFLAMAAGAISQAQRGYDENRRGWFGVLHLNTDTVSGLGPVRTLTHGTTLHGVQALDSRFACRPLSYYAPDGLIGQVFGTLAAQRPRLSLAVAGLGTGAVSAFLRPQDQIRFYEIDPLMVRVASDPRRFTYLSRCAGGRASIVLGDARVGLSREPAGSFDLVMADAFSSDAVPTHLLTVEALRVYLRAAKPGGLVLLHLSNRNLALQGYAAATVRAAGAYGLVGEYRVSEDVHPYVASAHEVMLVAARPEALAPFRARPEWRELPPGGRPWTDDYTNVVGAALARLRGG